MLKQDHGNNNLVDCVQNVPVVESILDETLNDSDKTITVPNNEQWKILYMHADLTTSATVGNRQIDVEVYDKNSNIRMHVEAGAVQAASTTRHYEWMQGIFRESAFIAASIQCPIPIDFYLKPGWSIRIFDENAVDAAADDLSISIVYEKAKV